MKRGFPPWQAAECGAARAQSGNERPEGLGVSTTQHTEKTHNRRVFTSPGGSGELDEYSWSGDELCCLQHRATLKALTLLLLSQKVLGTEPHGPQHSASASNYQLSSEIINLLC